MWRSVGGSYGNWLRCVRPPSIVTMVPLVYDERSDARNTTVAAISSTEAGRPNGILAKLSRQRFSGVTFPVWYRLDADGNPDYDDPIVATEDRAINPDLERSMYQRSKSTTIEVKGSHVIYMSQPKAVAAFIEKAATEAK